MSFCATNSVFRELKNPAVETDQPFVENKHCGCFEDLCIEVQQDNNVRWSYIVRRCAVRKTILVKQTKHCSKMICGYVSYTFVF